MPSSRRRQLVLVLAAVGAVVLIAATAISRQSGGSAAAPPSSRIVAGSIVTGFSDAALSGKEAAARRDLAPGFHGQCGSSAGNVPSRMTRAGSSLSAIMCGVVGPSGFTLRSLHLHGSTLALATVEYQVPHSKARTLTFNLRGTSAGWRISSISSL